MLCINDKNLCCKGEKCDNKEWGMNYEHPFPRVLGYDNIMKVDITEFRV